MTNGFYNDAGTLTANQLARASAVVAEFQSVKAGFDKLPTETELKQGATTYAADTGTANTYVVTLPYAPASYAAGLFVVMKVLTTNTGASTFNANALGAIALNRSDGTATVAGDLVAGQIVLLGFDGTGMRILSASLAEISTALVAAEAAQAAAELAQSNAEGEVVLAAAQVVIATAQAGIATTKASEAAASAAAASASAGAVSRRYLTVAGTDTLTSTATPTVTTYGTGLTIRFVPVADNTGAVTIDIDGVGAVAVTDATATALAAGALVAGTLVTATYDGTQFRVVGAGNLDLAGASALNIGGTTFDTTDKGSVGSGTVTFTVSDDAKQKLTVTGALTIAFSGWPTTGNYAEVEIELVNGSTNVTFPTINWTVGDGTTSTTFAATGITLAATGTNHIIVWSTDGGTTLYGVAS
jgi:hypothetical protein